MPFIADGVCDDEVERLIEKRKLPYDEMTIECELNHSERFDTISLSVGILDTEGKAEEGFNTVRLIYNPLENEKDWLFSTNINFAIIESTSSEILSQLCTHEHLVSIATSTPFVKRTKSSDVSCVPFNLHDISDITLSKAAETKLQENTEVSANECLLIEQDKQYEEAYLNSNIPAPLVTSAVTSRVETAVKASTPTVEVIASSELKVRKGVDVRPRAKEEKDIQGGSIGRKEKFVTKPQQELKTQRSLVERELSNVWKIRGKFNAKMFTEKCKAENLQRQEKDSELRLIRKMRENSLKEMEMEEKEKNRRDKQSKITSELENVRRLRRDFSGPEDENAIYCSVREGIKSPVISEPGEDVAGNTEFGVVLPSSIHDEVFYQSQAESRPAKARSVTEEELAMVRNIRSNMTFEEDENVFYKDSSKEIAELEYHLELAKNMASNADVAEEHVPGKDAKTKELEWIRHYRSHAEMSPHRLDINHAAEDDKGISEVRNLRAGYSPDALMAERRARSASERLKAEELERELMSIRKTRQSEIYSPESKGNKSSSESDLEEVRRLKRTRSLGSLPAFIGKSSEEKKRNKPWIFGGVNILPYREVAINIDNSKEGSTNDAIEKGSQKSVQEQSKMPGDFGNEGMKRNEEKFAGGHDCHKVSNVEKEEEPTKEKLKKQIKRGYTIV